MRQQIRVALASVAIAGLTGSVWAQDGASNKAVGPFPLIQQGGPSWSQGRP
jgi:hypothetical protein